MEKTSLVTRFCEISQRTLMDTTILCLMSNTGSNQVDAVKCTYRTSEMKKDIKEEATRHLSEDHRVKATDVKPAMFKFDKIKTQLILTLCF